MQIACGVDLQWWYSGNRGAGRTGLLVKRCDVSELVLAIGQLLDNRALARAMGEAGRRRVLKGFTWDASARHLAALIEGVPHNAPYPALVAGGETIA